MTDRSTVRYLLDTNICIYIAKGQPLAVRARFEQHALHDVAMSTITLGELRFGAEKSQARERALNTIEQLMQVIPACALPLEAGEHYGQIRAALQQQKDGSASELAVLHLAEQWREQMLQDTSHEQALTNWLQQHPATDAQHLRALVRQARKDAQKAAKEPVSDASDTAPRHGKAYRDVFQLIKQALLQGGAGNADDAQAQAEQEQDGMSDSGND